MTFPLRVRKLICKHRGCKPLAKYTKQMPGVSLVAYVCPRCEQGHAEGWTGNYPLRRNT